MTCLIIMAICLICLPKTPFVSSKKLIAALRQVYRSLWASSKLSLPKAKRHGFSLPRSIRLESPLL